jgi:hypothetical protein
MPLRYHKATDKASRGGAARNLSRNCRDVAFDHGERLSVARCILPTCSPPKPTFISYKVARSRLDWLRLVTQDPMRPSVPIQLILHSGHPTSRTPTSTVNSC